MNRRIVLTLALAISGAALAQTPQPPEVAAKHYLVIDLTSDKVLAQRDADAPADPASHIAGAVYVSCSGRGGPHFGAPSAELQIVRHALGDVPLVGFFAAGEIGHRHLYGYTGVLTVFTRGLG